MKLLLNTMAVCGGLLAAGTPAAWSQTPDKSAPAATGLLGTGSTTKGASGGSGSTMGNGGAYTGADSTGSGGAPTGNGQTGTSAQPSSQKQP